MFKVNFRSAISVISTIFFRAKKSTVTSHINSILLVAALPLIDAVMRI